MEDEDDNPVEAAFSAIEDAALKSDPAAHWDAPRDVWWWRRLKFASVILLPALILGLGFLFEDYIEEYRADSSYDRDAARREVQHDTVGSMKFRFWVGASVGGGLGTIYVVRCILRRVDP